MRPTLPVSVSAHIRSVSFMPTVADLEALLYRHDPVGLRAAGAPSDEYRPEAETVFARLPEAETVADVQQILHSEFVEWFTADTAGDASRYEPAAVEVWAALQPA